MAGACAEFIARSASEQTVAHITAIAARLFNQIAAVHPFSTGPTYKTPAPFNGFVHLPGGAALPGLTRSIAHLNGGNSSDSPAPDHGLVPPFHVRLTAGGASRPAIRSHGILTETPSGVSEAERARAKRRPVAAKWNDAQRGRVKIHSLTPIRAIVSSVFTASPSLEVAT